jgi:hypothetical protein
VALYKNSTHLRRLHAYVSFLFPDCLISLVHWQVSEGLFSEYQLPNGRTAFLYYNAGTAMDEAGFAPVQPPMRPTTVPLALQQSMPLANVMSLIAKPPGTAQPHKPYKPVPRLVPLPGSHTLTVARPELRTAESYGQLRAENMQLLLKAEVWLLHPFELNQTAGLLHGQLAGSCFGRAPCQIVCCKCSCWACKHCVTGQ